MKAHHLHDGVKAEWRDGRYNSCSLSLTNELCVSVSWNSVRSRDESRPIGYRISFAGFTIEEEPQSMETAKKLGEELAWRVLTKAINRLPHHPQGGK